MTQVVSISANTAAYASEAMKPVRRLSVKALAEENRITAERGVSRDQTGVPSVEQLIPASAAGLELLSSEQQPQQRTTLAQAQAAYRDLDD